jgi:trehalose synthase
MVQSRLICLEDYRPLIGTTVTERIADKARHFEGLRVVDFNSTYYGGGVAELLASMTLLMNSLNIPSDWRILRGTPDFFDLTKKIHNALQGSIVELTATEQQCFEEVIFENAVRNHLDYDLIIVHDPQPLPLITHYQKRVPWIWRCHIDLTSPHQSVWKYLVPFIDRYDGVIVSSEDYIHKLIPPQMVFMPAIDPFNDTNRELSDEEIDQCLAKYDIPTDLPIVAQISRFDPWKDPHGVIEAFKLARRDIDARLVLLGNLATDDPEGVEIYNSLVNNREDRLLILPPVEDAILVNSLQRRAAVILQKSLREGFGLTVSEAMWKGAPVIGGNVGGIRHQIQNGINGFLVSSVEEAAARMVQLLKDRALRERLGGAARETVKEKFLLTRLVEQHLDLFKQYAAMGR